MYEGLTNSLYESNIETIEIKGDELLEELKALGQFSITIKGIKVFKGNRETNKPLKFNEDEATFMFDDYRYLVKGLRLISPSKLKVVISVFHGQQAFTDTVNLNSFRSRKSFSKVLNEELGLTETDSHLTKIQLWLEQKTKKIVDENKEIVITEKERVEAINFLKQPNLIELIKNDIGKLGYIGEDNNKLLMYLVATSRKLFSPLSAQIRSQSSAGKSYLMEKVSELIPPEDVLYFTKITPQSLYYLDKDGLINKLLIIDEASKNEDTQFSIRSLQSRKSLSLAVVMKDPNSGKSRTKFFIVHGPIAYFDSSTGYENFENENRNFTVALDETESQTQLIMNALNSKRALRNQPDTSETIKLHQNAQRLLRPIKVVLPFVDKLTFPSHFIRARRDYDRFLSLIESIAFLHQYQRKIESDSSGEYIIGTVEDYALAYSLQSEVISNSICELNSNCKDVLDTIVQCVGKIAKETARDSQAIDFTRKEVRFWTFKPDHVIKRTMKELEELEYLSRRISGGKYIYRLSSVDFTQYKNNMIHPSELLV